MKDGIPVPTSPADGDHLWMNIMLDIGQTDRQCQGKWVNIISYWTLDTLTDSVKVSGSISYHIILAIRYTDRLSQGKWVNIISYWPLAIGLTERQCQDKWVNIMSCWTLDTLTDFRFFNHIAGVPHDTPKLKM